MNILYVSLNSLVMDGWSYQENMLSKAHIKLGHNVSIITSHWVFDEKGEMSFDERNEYIDENGAKIIRLKMKGKDTFSKKLRKFYGLKEAIEKEKPDFIFIHSVNFLDVPILVKYLKEHKNVKACADNHGDFSNSARNWVSKNVLHKFIWRRYAKKLIPVVDNFYGVMPARVDFLSKIYHIPKEKTSLLVMGVDDELRDKYLDENIINQTRAKFNVKESEFLIVTGGKIDLAKRQTLLLMKAVNELSENIKLLVFGPVASELRQEFDSLLSDRVIYLGWANNQQSYEYFAASDLVVFPGRHSVYWEQAVGMGKPLIVKYWEGTTHVDLGGNVTFLNNDSQTEIAEKILEIYNDKEKYQQMKEIAQERGIQKFSYINIAKESLT